MRTEGVSVAEIRPRVDFACCWRGVPRQVWFVYRVPSHHFLLVESGTLRARTASGEHRAEPGEMLCLRREPRTEYGYSGRVDYWETHLSFAPPPHQALPLWMEGEPLPERIVLGEHAGAARRAFETLCLEIDRVGDLARLRVGAAVHDLLGAIAAALGREPARRVRADPWQRARVRLESELGRPLTAAAIARELGIGEDHFIRAFRRRFGISPMAYRQQARLRTAAAQLGAGELAVKEIAHRLGFADASAFARAFRRQFGLAPSELRVAGAPMTPVVTEESPYPLNRHVRPPGSDTAWFTWG